jgi:glucose/mannose transport system substrate-binding protein
MRLKDLLYVGVAGVIASVAPAVTKAADVKEVQMVHWWTSGGEAAALNVLKQDLAKEGYAWKDIPIAGGAGNAATTALRAMVTSGQVPTAVQLLGYAIQDWAEQGQLTNLDPVASKEGWDKVVPVELQKFAKYDGHWVAAPVNIHSVNWLWINKSLLDKFGGKAPENWDELLALLDKAKAAGTIALAQGGQPWQEATMFDSVVLATGGLDFYKKAFIDLDPTALTSPTMKTAFERLGKLKTYVDPNYSNRDWNLATSMVIKGDALMQVMGDWAKGEFKSAGKEPGKDFVCARFPGTQGDVVFNSDMFAMFKVGQDRQNAQFALARATESPSFQSSFNVVKGSAPARTDVPDTAFDSCGKKAIADVREAVDNHTLVGSMAQGYAQPAAIQQAYQEVVDKFFQGQIKSPEAAVQQLSDSFDAAK